MSVAGPGNSADPLGIAVIAERETSISRFAVDRDTAAVCLEVPQEVCGPDIAATQGWLAACACRSIGAERDAQRFHYCIGAMPVADNSTALMCSSTLSFKLRLNLLVDIRA